MLLLCWPREVEEEVDIFKRYLVGLNYTICFIFLHNYSIAFQMLVLGYVEGSNHHTVSVNTTWTCVCIQGHLNSV